jgi:hypothetical protein
MKGADRSLSVKSDRGAFHGKGHDGGMAPGMAVIKNV